MLPSDYKKLMDFSRSHTTAEVKEYAEELRTLHLLHAGRALNSVYKQCWHLFHTVFYKHIFYNMRKDVLRSDCSASLKSEYKNFKALVYECENKLYFQNADAMASLISLMRSCCTIYTLGTSDAVFKGISRVSKVCNVIIRRLRSVTKC